MRASFAFWDTSAIIPLYCNQVTSAESRRLRRQFGELVIWWGTHIEVHSGINRLFREGLLNSLQSRKALEKWTRLYSRARAIKPDDKVLRVAVSLPSEYNIWAMDAFQLAAALVWCGERPRNRPFVCADQRLGQAATDAGFDVVSLM